MKTREREIKDLCEKHLHCANLSINIRSTHNIELVFVACTTGHRIIFECKRVYLYNITRDFDDHDSYFIGEVKVFHQNVENALAAEGWTFSERILPEHAWVIKIEGGVHIKIICLELDYFQE